MKVILYGEVHEIGAGVYEDPTSKQQVRPAQRLGLRRGGPVWALERRARRAPQRLRPLRPRARRLRSPRGADHVRQRSHDGRRPGRASSPSTANVRARPALGISAALLPLLHRRLRIPHEPQRYTEGTVDVRPHVFLGEHFGVAADVSYQARLYACPDPTVARRARRSYAGIWRFGFMPYFSPTGRGSYKRPQFRLVYAALGAERRRTRQLPGRGHPRAERDVQHYLGLDVEWWFNSSRIREAVTMRLRESPSSRSSSASRSCRTRPRASPSRQGQAPRRSRTHVDDWRDEVIYQVLVDRFADGDINND